jgi:transposase-like protein
MNIPVSEVAQQFGVSRMTVYSWFTGTSRPRKDKVDQIEKLLKA